MNLIPIILAPMHGYADALMRDVLTQIGGFDEVVSEFVRITHTVHSRKTWLKNIPELNYASKTPAGVPCTVQLLGSDAHNLAVNALEAVACGARKIDLNFGCPAPTVNQHEGGAVLLKNPRQIEYIVDTVRKRLPENITLSAKMRLGFDNALLALDCARAIADGGADVLTVHARTKVQGYQPPALWEYFARIQNVVDIPLVANGDIFSLDDAKQVCALFRPAGLMLGRGVLMYPDLAKQIRAFGQNNPINPMDWTQISAYLLLFFNRCYGDKPHEKYAAARLKQWLAMLAKAHPQALVLFNSIKKLTKNQEIKDCLVAHACSSVR